MREDATIGGAKEEINERVMKSGGSEQMGGVVGELNVVANTMVGTGKAFAMESGTAGSMVGNVLLRIQWFQYC